MDNSPLFDAEDHDEDTSRQFFLTTSVQRHFVCSEDAYISLEPYHGGSVRVGGDLVPASGTGVARIQIAAPAGGINTLYLRRAVYCPSTSINLVSVCSLLEDGIFWDTGLAALYTVDGLDRRKPIASVDRVGESTLFAIRLPAPDALALHSSPAIPRSPWLATQSPLPTQLPPLRPTLPQPAHRQDSDHPSPIGFENGRGGAEEEPETLH